MTTTSNVIYADFQYYRFVILLSVSFPLVLFFFFNKTIFYWLLTRFYTLQYCVFNNYRYNRTRVYTNEYRFLPFPQTVYSN